MEQVVESSTAAALPPSERTQQIRSPSAQGPWIMEVGSPDGGQRQVLGVGERLVIGSGAGAQVRVEDRAVSARHCGVVATRDGLRVTDLNSTNGLFVGPARVPEAILAGHGGSFVIGRTTVSLRPQTADDNVPDGHTLPGIVGSSAAMRRIAVEVRRYAALRAPVLLQGESGTGKDVVARALHTLAGRGGAYVPLNVSAIPDALADAELFGHRRGAFTGAVASRAGAFEQADGGTLLLDEIAELAPKIQVKLLRVVEDGMVRPVGASRPLRVTVRIVSASWAPLAERVADGRFRLDLFHRLSTVLLELPPLRQRKSDIPALSQALLKRTVGEFGTKRLCSAALARLVSHHWPGNVRELASVLYRAAAHSDGVDILPRHILIAAQRSRTSHAPNMDPSAALELLACHDGNVSAAARAARVARSTFRAWVERGRTERARQR